MRIVSLPWYDTARSKEALDRFWISLRRELSEVARLPKHLERSLSLREQWTHPNLLLSQCCGPDLFGAARGLEPVARPVFDLDCEAGMYFSHVVKASGAHSSARRVAINALSSRSGCTALLAWLAQRTWTPNEVLVSGSHAASMDALRQGRADIAAIDAVSWRVLDTQGLSIIGKTDSAPAPPYVKRKNSDVAKQRFFRALAEAVGEAGAELGISAILPADLNLYRPLAQEVARYKSKLARADSA